MSTPAFEDPFAALDPDEAEQAAYVSSAASRPDLTNVGVAAALGGAFLVYRQYLRKRLRDRLDQIDTSDPDAMGREVYQAFRTFMPAWGAMVGPVLLRGYLNGISETGLIMDSRFLTDLADNYAYSLGQHINDVSAEALVKGYAAQVNRKVPAKIALANVIDAFGVTNRTAKALTTVLSGKEDAKLSETLVPSIKKARAQSLIAAAVKQRADTIGQQEAWNAHEQGKQVVWLYAMRQGIIPETATRKWVTAEDELVCPYCGPMHEVEQVISEPFEMPDGNKLWSPPVHPNCRCEVKLKANLGRKIAQSAVFADTGRHWIDDEPQVAVAKALDWEPEEHPRSERSGRFVRAGFKDADPVDLQSLVQDAELRDLTTAKPGLREQPAAGLRGGAGLRSQTPGLRGGAGLRGGLRGEGGLRGGGLDRGPLKRGRRKQEIDRGSIERELRKARARQDGRIMARGDDITLDESDIEERDYPGLQATDEPMYGILDHQGIKARNEIVHFDGVEVAGGLDNLYDRLAEMDAQNDYDCVRDLYETGDAEDALHTYGLIPHDFPEGSWFTLDDQAVAAAIAFARDVHDGESLVGDDYVEMPVLGYIDSATGEPISEEVYNDYIDSADHDNAPYGMYDVDQVGTETVSIAAMAEALDLHTYVRLASPKIIRLDKVRDNDVLYDAKHRPYANPVDQYKITDNISVQIHGRSYTGFHVEPDWDQ